MRLFPKNLWAKFALLFLVAATFFACQKEIDGGSGIIIPTPAVDPNTDLDLSAKVSAASISGFVTDESNAAVVGASVLIGGTTITTDKYGYFETKNASVVKNAAVVTVSKTGYFKGIKTFIAAEGKSAFFRIKLLAKTPTPAGFSAAAGGTVTSADGIKIIFPANAIVTSAGVAYTGNVNVAARFIDPASSELSKIMPGDLRGIDSLNAVKKLTTYGMAAVELTGTAGETLQIATGKKASISFPLPASVAGTAPATIPLWHFDETLGLWKQDGKATKTGNSYVGDVSHFSFWNCDVPSVYTQLSCTLKTSGGAPLPFALVKISKIDEPQNSAWGLTDSTGYVNGAVPANSALKLEVFSAYECGTAIHTQTVNITQQPVDLGIITVTVPTANFANVTGAVTNCNNAPVTSGYIMVRSDNSFYRFPISNTGTYSFVRVLCSGPQASAFIAEDIAGGQQNATPVTFTINSGNNTVPAIQACGVSTNQFINYSAKGISKTLTYPADTLTARLSQGFISIYGSVNTVPIENNFIGFGFSATNLAVGSTPEISNLQSTVTQPLTFTLPAPVLVNITEYSGPGGFIGGNISGTLNERDPALPPGSPPGPAFTFTCSFRLRVQ